MAIDCNTKPDYTCVDLGCTDACALSREYSCNEAAYPPGSMDEAPVGSCVEFNVDGERVWLKVRATCKCYALGEVMRPLQMPHDFKVGDLIRVEICHIYNVERKAAWCLNYKS
jgi:hypothetical protein